MTRNSLSSSSDSNKAAEESSESPSPVQRYRIIGPGFPKSCLQREDWAPLKSLSRTKPQSSQEQNLDPSH